MKWNRKPKTKKVKALAFFGTASLLGTILYASIVGFSYAAAAIGTISLLVLSAPSGIAGASLLEVVGSIFEMLIEGVVVVFEVIGGLLS